jgi:hypothetical protein
MTTRARLVDSVRIKHDMAIPGDMRIGMGLWASDVPKLLALVEACVKWESALTPDGSVMIGEPELRAALRAVTQEGA